MLSPAVQVAIVAAVPSTVIGVVGLVLKHSIQEIHLSINSRFDQFLKAAKDASFAEGQKSERDKNESPR